MSDKRMALSVSLPKSALADPLEDPAAALERLGLGRFFGAGELSSLGSAAADAFVRMRFAPSAGFALTGDERRILDGAGANYGVLPDMAFRDLRLIASDMDSTFITVECIDEIAAAAGVKDRVAEITRRTLNGELDFSEALALRVSLLKGLDAEAALGGVYRDVLGVTEGADRLARACVDQGVEFLLVSGGFTYFTRRLQKRFALAHELANVLEIDSEGKLTGKTVGPVIDSAAKRREIERLAKEGGYGMDRVAAVGDGANDVPMLKLAGVGVSFKGKAVNRAAADCVINAGGLDELMRFFR